MFGTLAPAPRNGEEKPSPLSAAKQTHEEPTDSAGGGRDNQQETASGYYPASRPHQDLPRYVRYLLTAPSFISRRGVNRYGFSSLVAAQRAIQVRSINAINPGVCGSGPLSSVFYNVREPLKSLSPVFISNLHRPSMITPPHAGHMVEITASHPIRLFPLQSSARHGRPGKREIQRDRFTAGGP